MYVYNYVSQSVSVCQIPLISINPRRACAARVTCTVVILSFCLSVCLSRSVCLLPYFLPLRATRRPIGDTNGLSATLVFYLKYLFVKMLRSKVMAYGETKRRS